MLQPFHILRVNLTTGALRSEEIPRSWSRSFIGGKGLAAAYLFRDLAAGVDPLSPGNRLVLAVGPLVGIAPGCSRYCVATKSPLTGAFLDSYSGGLFPAQLRFALPDHLGVVFEGKADHLVYLKIDEGKASLEDARSLEGASTSVVASKFKGYHVAAIGPAGENLVKYATVTCDGGKHHAGRGGAGCVMGAKNLKAVVVRGRPIQDSRVEALRDADFERLAHGDEKRGTRENGTPGMVLVSNNAGTLPTRNWTRGSYGDAQAIGIDAFRRNTKHRVACFLCPVACGYNLELKEGAYAGLVTGKGPEYETVGMMGSNLEIGDLSAVAELGHACDELGMDTITTGSVLGFAMECAERGIIEDPVRFGSAGEALRLVRMIAGREGIGDLLAEGTRSAAKHIGGEARGLPVEFKGLEVPAWEPRGSLSMALAYATSDRGACHMRSWALGGDLFGSRNPFAVEKGHATAVISDQNQSSLIWSLVACAFTAYTQERALTWLNALGYEYERSELDQIGERIWNLTRQFNVREGLRRDEDVPSRLAEVPLQDAGKSEGRVLSRSDLSDLLDEYYAQRGWDAQGRPSEAKLAEIGLGGPEWGASANRKKEH